MPKCRVGRPWGDGYGGKVSRDACETPEKSVRRGGWGQSHLLFPLRSFSLQYHPRGARDLYPESLGAESKRGGRQESR